MNPTRPHQKHTGRGSESRDPRSCNSFVGGAGLGLNYFCGRRILSTDVQGSAYRSLLAVTYSDNGSCWGRSEVSCTASVVWVTVMAMNGGTGWLENVLM